MHKFYTYCVVPQCGNTTEKTPKKLFILVPSQLEMRRKWLKLAGREPDGYSPDSPIYFCEDHFDVPNDMENYMKYHVMGYVPKALVKPGCVPTRFPCKLVRSTEIKNERRNLKQPNILNKAKIMKECLNVEISQLHNTLIGKSSDTDSTKYDKSVDLKCYKNFEFLYEVVKEETFKDDETYNKSFNEEGARSINKEFIKHMDDNNEFLGYISKVETIENENKNINLQQASIPVSNVHALNSQQVNFCSEARDKDISSSSLEVDTDIKIESEDKTDENQQVILDYISKIDIHEHEILASVVNSENHNSESDTKPLIKYINDDVTGLEINYGSIRFDTEDGMDIKPIIIPDIDSLNQEMTELTNSNIRESEGHYKPMDDNFAMDTKPIQGVNDTGEETNDIRISKEDSQFPVNNTDNNAKGYIIALNRSRKRETKISNPKRTITHKTDDVFNRNKNKDNDLYNDRRVKTKHLKDNRSNPKKTTRNLFNPKIKTVSSNDKTNFDIEHQKFSVSDFNKDQNNEIDFHNLETRHLDIANNSNKYGDNYLEYKYSCITCNFRTNIKKWMDSHAILHLDKNTDNILVCEHCDYITKVKFRLIKHMETHMNQIRYECKICPYKCKYSYTLISHMTTHVEKPLSCSICDYKCAHKRLLNNHLKTHTNKKPFECDHCGYRSSLKQYLVKHIRTHTGEKPYSCKLCDGKFAWSSDLAKHLRIHSNDKPHSCDICAYKTVDKQTLVKHLRIHSGEKPFTCKYCPYASSFRSSLHTHLRIHSDERPYTCKLCSYTSKQWGALASHMRTHTKEKPYKCTLCDYRATQKVHLNRHIMRHTGEKPFACNICSYKCTQKGTLADHMKTHTYNRPYPCEFCEYRCARKSLLVLHIRTHTGEKPFSCDQCDFKCARSGSLQSHKLTHTGLKPYICGVCNRKLRSKSGLNKHKACHTGEKPYVCELCEYSVTKKKSLTLHMSKHKSKTEQI